MLQATSAGTLRHHRSAREKTVRNGRSHRRQTGPVGRRVAGDGRAGARGAAHLSRQSRAAGARAAPGRDFRAARVRRRTACCSACRNCRASSRSIPDNRIARVEPGVRNLAISEAAAQYGLYYAPDPSSQIACSIGGNVAENSGGVHCLKYGLTVHNVLGLKLLTIEGDELTLGGATLDSPGYDLLALFNGSEGMLGIVTEVTVRLLPIPATKRLVLAAFASARSRGRRGRQDHRERHRAGGTRNDGRARDRGGRGVRRRRLSDRRRGDSAVRTRRHARRSRRTERAGAAADARADTRPKYARRATTRIGSGCGSAAKRRSPRWAGSRRTTTAWTARFPRARLAEVLRAIEKLSERFGLGGRQRVPRRRRQSASADPVRRERAGRTGRKPRKWAAKFSRCASRVGGTVTGEHGVGVEKLDAMCGQFAAPELEQFHTSQSRLRSGWAAQSGQSGAHARAVRRGRRHARAPREDRVPRDRAFLNAA